MTGSRSVRRAEAWFRALVGGLIVVASLGVGLITPGQAAAQDPEAMIEALALRVHVQNLRAYSYTFWSGGDMGDPDNRPSRSILGDKLDNWTLSGMAGDADLASNTLTRPTVLNFWASWCTPCQMEFRHLAATALEDTHPYDVIFVNISDEAQEAADFLEQYPDDIYTVLDKDESLGIRTRLDSLPTTFLLAADGTVLAIHVGMFTPTVAAFFDAAANYPGVGSFDEDDYDGPKAPTADLLPVTVDEAAPLAVNETVKGTISDADYQDVYRFDGSKGDKVTLAMEADESEVDAYLVLMTADGKRLAENDDAESGYTDSGITAKLPDDGTYLVVATRFLEAEGFKAGAYLLTLELDQ